MFNQPQAAPEAVNSGSFVQSPIDIEIDFNGRKSQAQGIRGKVSAEDLNVCFSYYKRSDIEGEKGQVVKVDKFTFFILGIYSRFAGTVFNQDKPKESEHYTSTLYRSKKDLAFFRKEYVKKIRENEAYANHWCVGNYDQLRAFADRQTYRQSVGFKKTALCYCIESDSIVEIGISRRVEYGMAKAIADATNTPHNANRINGLNLLTTEFWGFSFNGKYQEVTDVKGKECVPVSDKGEWGFAPIFTCVTVRASSTNPDSLKVYARCAELQMECDAYVDSQIQWAEQLASGNDSDSDDYESAQNTAPHPQAPRQSAPAFDPTFPDKEPVFEDAQATFDSLPF